MLGPFELALINLADALGPGHTYFVPVEKARSDLRAYTGIDLGNDPELWFQWGVANSAFIDKTSEVQVRRTLDWKREISEDS